MSTPYNLNFQFFKIKPQVPRTKIYDTGLDTTKPVFGGLQTTQAQTSLPIRSVWSALLLFTYWKVPYVNLLQVKFQFSS